MRLRLSHKYILSTTAVLLTVMGITLSIISSRHEALVIEQARLQAKALFQQIVITRRWVSDHGGVFVEQLPWTEKKPLLKNNVMIDKGGRYYIKQNPAMVTKQLSQYAQKDKLYSFHITSLKLLNPENAPDLFERESLQDFQDKKSRDASKTEKVNGTHYFRYIAPLYVEQACLECHSAQGYHVGDVRGAISITVPMDYAYQLIASDRRYMIIGGLLAVALLMLVLFMITRWMVIGPINAIRDHMQNFAKKGNADMHALATGDELEDLSRSFLDMAEAIENYHGCLQEKISAATGELVAKNNELLRLNRSKSDFIAKISHELRTPLTSIKGAMDYLSTRMAVQGNPGDEDAAAFFGVIKKNAERMIRLVNNILDYERIELGEFEMHFRELSLREVFQEVILGFRSEADRKQIDISLDSDDVTVWADEDRIRQVLINLISNALNFSPVGSRIRIELRQERSDAIVTVHDEGQGIAEAEQALVFNQFYTKGIKNGTGLGLAICRGIVEAHDGVIGFTSSPGGGSSFYFRIPIERKHFNGKEEKTACNR